MGDFMRDHGGELVIVFGDFVESAEDADLPAGHREGVDLLRDFEDDKLPIGIGHIPENDLRNPIPDSLELGDALFVAREGILTFHVVERGDAHFGDLFVIDEIHRLAAGNGHLIATAEEEDDQQKRNGEKSGRKFHGSEGNCGRSGNR